jgi:hypothetical protein
VNALSIAAQAGEPLAAWFSPETPLARAAGQRFECASYGDRVSGRWWRPDGIASALVLAVHDLGRDKDDPALAAAAQTWARAGWATAAIDLPLHGERHNAKLTRRAIAASAPGAHADRALWLGLLAQGVRDLARALDALATRGPLPPVVCLGFGDAAAIALAFAGLDARVRQTAAIGTPRDSAAPAGAHAAKPLAWIARPDDLRLAL